MPGLSATKARSRVRAYRQGGGVWIGGNEVTASLRMPIVQAGRRPKVGPGGRPIIINNQIERHAFVWLSRDIGRQTRYTGTPFRWVSRGNVQPVLVDISGEAQDLWQDLRAFTPEKVDEIFRQKALQIVQTRGQ